IVREQITVAFAFDYAVTGKEDDDHIIRFDRARQRCAERTADCGERGILVDQECELARRETAAIRAAQESGEGFGIAIRKFELLLLRKVFVIRHADHDCPQLSATVESAAAANLFNLQPPIGAATRLPTRLLCPPTLCAGWPREYLRAQNTQQRRNQKR